VIGEAVLVTSSSLEERAGVPGLAGASTSQGDLYRQLTRVLDELEAQHGSVIYVPDGNLESEWSLRCLRMADRVLLLADAQASPAVSAAESLLLGAERRVTTAEQVLVLLHSDDAAIPAGTEAWLDQRPKGSIVAHLHIRPSRNEDMARLARTQSARAIGLVLCGGGARCISQLGVYKALQEHGIAVDYVGGSGLGAAMGALIALGRPADEIIAYAREAFTANPTGDVSLMPVTSLIKGRQLKGIIDDAIEHLARKGARIEDTWKTYFCVASNYSKACEVVLRRGPLAKSIRASAAVPGLLPPVPIDGDLMVDGGAFNHYPTDVMWRSGTAKIIGVTLSRDASPGGDLDEVPGAWTLAWDRVTGRRRQFRIPTLMAILMNSTTLASASREPIASSLVDLEFTPNLPSVGLLDWQSFDHAVKVGHQLAAKKLAGMTREELAPYRGA
jgi:NTE family protein